MGKKLTKAEEKQLAAARLQHAENLEAAVRAERVSIQTFAQAGKAIQADGKQTRAEIESMKNTFISFNLEPMTEIAAVMVDTINSLHSQDKNGRDGRKKVYVRHFAKIFDGCKLVIEYNRSSRLYFATVMVIDSVAEAVEKELAILQRLSTDYPTIINLTIGTDDLKAALTAIITERAAKVAERDKAAEAARMIEATEMRAARKDSLYAEIAALEASEVTN